MKHAGEYRVEAIVRHITDDADGLTDQVINALHDAGIHIKAGPVAFQVSEVSV